MTTGAREPFLNPGSTVPRPAANSARRLVHGKVEGTVRARILPFDEKALGAADGGGKGGWPRSALGMIAAAVPAANDCDAATTKEKGFARLAIVNPMRG